MSWIPLNHARQECTAVVMIMSDSIERLFLRILYSTIAEVFLHIINQRLWTPKWNNRFLRSFIMQNRIQHPCRSFRQTMKFSYYLWSHFARNSVSFWHWIFTNFSAASQMNEDSWRPEGKPRDFQQNWYVWCSEN